MVHGAPCRFSDPARFSLAHGGKDGHPFPVPLTVYDETIEVLKTAVGRAKLGDDEKLAAIRRLDAQARMLERTAGAPTFDEYVGEERRRSRAYGGASVTTPPRRRAKPATTRGTATTRRPGTAGQLRLF